MKNILFIPVFFLSSILVAEEVLRGTILWVVDGDTVLLRYDNELATIRLWGIDAPEKKQTGGKASTYFLVKMIGRKRVKVVIEGRGKYGRIIGKIYYKNKFINLEMVKAGHAWWNEKYCPGANEFRVAEKQAKKSKAGLWKHPKPVRPEFFRNPEGVIKPH